MRETQIELETSLKLDSSLNQALADFKLCSKPEFKRLSWESVKILLLGRILLGSETTLIFTQS